MSIKQIIRPEIAALSAYHVPSSDGYVKLDAMENPFPLPAALQAELAQHLAALPLNRYPVPSYVGLKALIAEQLAVPAGREIVLGNGSDELIAILSQACARPGAKVLAPVPGFVMYAMSARFAGLEFVGVPLNADFTLDAAAMLAAIAVHRPVITYLAYPNNPTGTLFDAADIVAILQAVGSSGIVVVDEAYGPFAGVSFMDRLAQFPNLVVMRTVSKLGLAGIRLGYMAGDNELMKEFDKVRPPYNINVLTEASAVFMLRHVEVLNAQAAELCRQREALTATLRALPGVEVFPSAANFLLIRVANAEQVFAKLLKHKILVKNVGKMHALLENCLRITVSNQEENALFSAAFAASLP
ncbi:MULTISPECIES: histidinol-phosphate transaminase [unclassified Undibacterium]|uniref:histidinol-phosphate transaminase n=1 Tax=unclassified Undibacterium TaxID=2630295 RepID=UPI002AC9B73A|nr:MULTISPECIES: histidinol-phosphate transaminase [unclassified Undibacterium]MEB0139725.1 histidinol-phosphate transaminase [Undibacterium sp. CCC2.1]MEB0172606.1 histidinol-phosphate transaminase [Undibacterium sp. CCC1.1]MEB0176413.1 histidinol-phosphate transaminase [Undibacterium sp. CCC3.4]MEB0215729.1 histidinol-phosphate transaminase [Undibacterium sp. 5I2]WPX45152.1 histidinol-phosphate transaminase [Undibacterium sp. CCC3.4]